MGHILKKQFMRFMLVGSINTVTDVTIYVLLLPIIASVFTVNLISTTAALVVSFMLNKNYAFRYKDIHKGQGILFVGITLAGTWILQPIVIRASDALLRGSILALGLGSYIVVITKLMAIATTVLWNYHLYKRFVFNNSMSHRNTNKA